MNRITRRLSLFCFFFCVFLCGCQSQTKIVNNIPAREANEIVVLLNSKGIAAVKSPTVVSAVGGATAAEQMWDISVPSNQITESLSFLNQSGLPRAKGTTLLDLFGAQGLVPSDMQDRIRYQEGLSEQLATTIRKMDGVLDANVQISFPQNEEEHKPLTASVYIKHLGVLDNPNSLLVTKIKRLVANAVPGLSIDNVSVVTDRAPFSEIHLSHGEVGSIQEKEYVSIWSIIIARESTARFRLIFYSFILLIFILACALTWVLWKFFLIIEESGGVKMLFNGHQLPPIPPEPIVKEGEDETP